MTTRPEKKITDPRMLAMKEKLATEEGKRIYANANTPFDEVLRAAGFSLRGHRAGVRDH